MKRDYSTITTLEGIEKALEENRRNCRKKEDLLRRKVAKAKEIYTPSNLVSEGFRSATGSLPFYGGVLTVVSVLRKIMKK